MMRQVIALIDEYQSKENAKHVLRAMKENARLWRDNLGETAAAIRMGCGGRVRREGRRDSFRTQAIFDCR